MAGTGGVMGALLVTVFFAVVAVLLLVVVAPRLKKKPRVVYLGGPKAVLDPLKQLEFVEEPPWVDLREQGEPKAQMRVEKVLKDRGQIVLALAVKIASEGFCEFELLCSRRCAYLLDDDRNKMAAENDSGEYRSGSQSGPFYHKVLSGEIYRFQVSFPRTPAPLKDIVFYHPQFQPVNIRLR